MYGRNKKLFLVLQEICSKINQQIPLAANRFEEFECTPLSPTLNANERKGVIDAIDAAYEEHEVLYGFASSQYRIYKLNEFLSDFYAVK